MSLIVDIVESHLNSLDFTLNIISYSDDTTNTTIIVERMFHSRAKLKITVDSVDMKIVSVSGNSIVLPGVLTPVIAVLMTPFYFHETPLGLNEKLGSKNNINDKLPCVWLLEILAEKYDRKATSPIEKHSDIRLYFLDAANKQDWDTDDKYDNVVRRMHDIALYFMDMVESNGCLFGSEVDFSIFLWATFGKYIDYKGAVQSIAGDALSGVELRVNLPVLEQQ